MIVIPPCQAALTFVLLIALNLSAAQPASPSLRSATAVESGASALRMPLAGTIELQVLTPTLLEVCLITEKSEGKPLTQWGFVDAKGVCRLPGEGEIEVLTQGSRLPLKNLGFKRRVLYAPLKQWDLRVVNYLYLELGAPIPEGQSVEVRNPDKKLWPASIRIAAATDRSRLSPAIHVNQTGYLPDLPKRAMVGYYLGSLGEMKFGGVATNGPTMPAPTGQGRSVGGGAATKFALIEEPTGKTVYEGRLSQRPDRGFPFECYQRVQEADFSNFTTAGRYRLCVPGLGVSYPFSIDEAVAGAFARTYALGIYHQRCGAANELPFTRFTHGPCHTQPAEVPDMSARFRSVNESLAKESANFKENPRHTAPQLKNVAASLYPFVRKGKIDVSGGHHDAGDYSKYTINSAAFIHYLVFAADAFPGVADLDNLGLPESGDGKSDVLQEAKWEADFLAKMQDSDGGFYFLVYPRDREYENNVLPDHGDPQIVFPKTTSATAAAVAALAQCSSSPAFKRQFPEAAAEYLTKAKQGWAFLEKAIAEHGKDGAYQKITHYGDQFMHDDELAWAVCELFLATHDAKFQKLLLDWFNPADPATRRWGWWRLYDAYGCATRSYAFAARTGRAKRSELSPLLLDACESEIAAAGEDQLRRAQQSAYGTSFPEETKRALSAGWYFSSDAAFDLAAACQLDFPEKRDLRPAMRDALLSNLNYEAGCNPVNMTYLTGIGWRRQREIVHQYAQNDRRVLPPTGIPLGNIQAGIGWNYLYKKEPDQLSFPSDGLKDAPYPFYDRWADAFNLSQEFVAVNQARALGYTCWLMAQTSLKKQQWKAIAAALKPSRNAKATGFTLSAAGIDLAGVPIVWEVDRGEPFFGGPTVVLTPQTGTQWVEAEAQMTDGRRLFGVWDAGSSAR